MKPTNFTAHCSLIDEPPPPKKDEEKLVTAKSRIWGAETPEPIATKFCIPGAIQDLITPVNFGEDRLRGFGVVRGRILAFSIDLLLAFKTLSHYHANACSTLNDEILYVTDGTKCLRNVFSVVIKRPI